MTPGWPEITWQQDLQADVEKAGGASAGDAERGRESGRGTIQGNKTRSASVYLLHIFWYFWFSNELHKLSKTKNIDKKIFIFKAESDRSVAYVTSGLFPQSEALIKPNHLHFQISLPKWNNKSLAMIQIRLSETADAWWGKFLMTILLQPLKLNGGGAREVCAWRQSVHIYEFWGWRWN